MGFFQDTKDISSFHNSGLVKDYLHFDDLPRCVDVSVQISDYLLMP